MDSPHDELSEAWLDSLQDSGYRLTAPRRAIVTIIAEAPRALEAIEIYDLGRQAHPRLGLVTVYRTLEKLEQLGLVQRVHQPDGCNMYLRAPRGTSTCCCASLAGRLNTSAVTTCPA